MAIAPDHSEIFNRAVEEGKRRLDQSLLELVSTSFIAGFTIVFGVVAFGIVHALVEPHFGNLARLAGALAFGVGLVFLIVGRAELFTENFFDPVATVYDRREPGMPRHLVRLWIVTLVLNLIGGTILALIVSVEGVLPEGTGASLRMLAEEIIRRETGVKFLTAVTGGALVTLLSFLLLAVNQVSSRIILAYLVGFLLALVPFDHVVVSVLHIIFGLLFGGDIGLDSFVQTTLVVLVGNFAGGLGLVTFTHIAQGEGARLSGD